MPIERGHVACGEPMIELGFAVSEGAISIVLDSFTNFRVLRL